MLGLLLKHFFLQIKLKPTYKYIMLEIEIEKNSIEAGKRLNYICTFDFASLESRVAAIDTCINKDGIDPILYELYKENSSMGEDMHTASVFAVFGSSIKKQVYDVIDDNGKKWLFIDESKLKVKRDGKEILIYGKDINEKYIIIDYYDGDEEP